MSGSAIGGAAGAGLGSPWALGGPLATGAGRRTQPWWLAGDVPASLCQAAYQPKGAASYAASKVNLAAPGTNDATEGTAPGWAAGTGWTFDGTQYLVTGLLALVGWAMLVRFSAYASDPSTNRFLAGAYVSGGRRFYLSPANSGNGVLYGAGANLRVLPAITEGVLGISDQVGYRNGQPDGAIGAGAFPSTLPIHIGQDGQGVAYCAAVHVQAMAVYNASLTAAQVAAVSAAMAAV